MRKGLFSVLGSGAIVLALVIGTSAATATTATTWTIKPGKAVTGTAGTIVVMDTATNVPMTCTSSSITAATLKSGTGQTNPLGKITAVAYSGCTAAGFGGSITASASSTHPWLLRGSTYSSGVTHGSIGSVQTKFMIGPFGACSGIVAGTSATTPGQMGVTYKNVNGSLIMHGGNLHAWNVSSSCGTNIHTGDPLTVTGTYKISPRQTITSP